MGFKPKDGLDALRAVNHDMPQAIDLLLQAQQAGVAVEIFFRRGEMGATCTAPTGASAARAEPNPQRARRRDGRRDDEVPIRDEEKREI